MANRDNAVGGALTRVACADLVDGLHAWRLWSKLAWHDMLARYRRSWVGPFWLVLTAAVFIGALSLIYGTLFRMDIDKFVPFVAIGVVTWGFISVVASEGNGPVSLSPFQSWPDYIIDTSGYDFGKGQINNSSLAYPVINSRSEGHSAGNSNAKYVCPASMGIENFGI